MLKRIKSSDYNYIFDSENGYFARWGKTLEDNPDYAPVGPEIADIEISTFCGMNCRVCYKSNTSQGKYMSLETFKTIFNKLPKTLAQVALGIGDLDLCPSLYGIMRYCRANDYNSVVPNLTINGNHLSDYHVKNLVELAGAVAVSRYNPNICYDTVKKLTDAGLKQVNIHQLLCVETYDTCLQVLDDMLLESRLGALRAIVFLLMKPKGNRNTYHQLRDLSKYRKLIDKALDNNIPIGFDSCSAPSFLKAVKERPEYKQLEICVEPCESNCFSSYINVDGRYFHCSFTENEDGWEGIDMLKVEDFTKDIWYSDEVKRFRGKLLDSQEKQGCRSCPIFNLDMNQGEVGL